MLRAVIPNPGAFSSGEGEGVAPFCFRVVVMPVSTVDIDIFDFSNSVQVYPLISTHRFHFPFLYKYDFCDA